MVCFVVAGSGGGLIGPIFDPMMHEFGWSSARTSTLATAYTLGYLLTTPAVGILVDKFGARVVMAVGAALAAAGLLLSSVCHLYWVMIVAFTITGIGFNAAFYLPSAVVITSWMEDRRALGMGIVMGAMSAGAALFSALVAWSIEVFGWRPTTQAVALVNALMILLIWLGVRMNTDTNGHLAENSEARGDDSAAGDSKIPLYVVVTIASGILFAFGMQGIYFHVVPVLSSAGFSTHMAGLAFGATWLLSGLGSLALGILADRVGAKATLASSLVCCGVGTLLLLGVAQSLSGLVCAVGFIVLWGVSLNCFGQLAPVIFAARVDSRRLGTLIGWQFASAGVAGAVSPIVTGMLYDKLGGYAAAIDLNSVAVFVAVALILTLKAPAEQLIPHRRT